LRRRICAGHHGFPGQTGLLLFGFCGSSLFSFLLVVDANDGKDQE